MASLPQVCDPSKLRAFDAILRSAISPFPNQRFNLLGLFEDHSIDEYAVFAQIISRQALQKRSYEIIRNNKWSSSHFVLKVQSLKVYKVNC